MPRARQSLILLTVVTIVWSMSLRMRAAADAEPTVTNADLLIVGGTESGWAAAIQAARMGVERIVLVNDIEWLGGQFTAEALVAIDENRSHEEVGRRSKRRRSSIPRSGLFKEMTDRIEAFNNEKYGHPRPGNTTVRTTCRPAEAEAIFRQMIQPYVDRGQVTIVSSYYPLSAETSNDGKTLRSVTFESVDDADDQFSVTASVTIDASDWGDVIQLAGAAFEYGPDLREKYNEPLAPVERDGYPLTDMNPISYCMIVEETDTEQVVPRPPHYDERRYVNTTGLTKAEHDALPWPHKPVDAFADVERVYASRRIVDHYGLDGVRGPDSILLCWFVQDYPLDILPHTLPKSWNDSHRVRRRRTSSRCRAPSARLSSTTPGSILWACCIICRRQFMTAWSSGVTTRRTVSGAFGSATSSARPTDCPRSHMFASRYGYGRCT